MRIQNNHPSDEDLLLLNDGELSSARSAEVRKHLEACWNCRTRVKEMEGAIADFIYVQRDELSRELPPFDGSRALLRARLAQSAAEAQKPGWRDRVHSLRPGRAWVYASVVLAALSGLVLLHHQASSLKTSLISIRTAPVPDSRLTPGAVRSVTRNEICSTGRRDMNRIVPPSVQQAVFKKYGIPGARVEDFEVDYLITPELGGADDIQNLWPEPYASNSWDAHVKDALEDRLHQMVCHGEIDLATAQHDMASDWISAYKKYFHTERPLAIDSAKPEENESETGNGKSI